MDYIEKAKLDGNEMECEITLKRIVTNKVELKDLIDLLEIDDDKLTFNIYSKNDDMIPVEIIRPSHNESLIINYGNDTVKQYLSNQQAVEVFNRIIGQKVCTDLILD